MSFKEKLLCGALFVGLGVVSVGGGYAVGKLVHASYNLDNVLYSKNIDENERQKILNNNNLAGKVGAGAGLVLFGFGVGVARALYRDMKREEEIDRGREN